jgi:hypothetical protein
LQVFYFIISMVANQELVQLPAILFRAWLSAAFSGILL